MYFIGVVFIFTAVAVAVFKKENNSLNKTSEVLNFVTSYKMVIRLIRLRPIQLLSFIYLTINVNKKVLSLSGNQKLSKKVGFLLRLA
jgi:hypothetical protein